MAISYNLDSAYCTFSENFLAHLCVYHQSIRRWNSHFSTISVIRSVPDRSSILDLQTRLERENPAHIKEIQSIGYGEFNTLTFVQNWIFASARESRDNQLSDINERSFTHKRCLIGIQKILINVLFLSNLPNTPSCHSESCEIIPHFTSLCL